MHICFLTPEYALESPCGGIGTYIRDAARWLVKHGHTVDVVVVTHSRVTDKADDEGVSVYFVPPRRIRLSRLLRWASQVPGCSGLYEAYLGWDLLEKSMGGWLAIHKLNRIRSYDLIEAADYSGLAFWGILWPFRRVPLMLRGHGFLDLSLEQFNWPGSYFQHRLERFCLQRADYVLTNSAYMARTYTQEFEVSKSRVGVLTLAFSQPRELSGKANFRNKLGWGAHDPVVMYVGRLELRKGIDVLFKALIEVQRQFPTMKAIFLGALTDCPQEVYDAFMSEAQGWAYHAGAVEPSLVAGYLREADFLVVPSRMEPLGRVFVEAELEGIPVIGTRVGGIPEVVVEGVTGLLVEPGDTQALSRAILALCRSPEMRAKMGQNAREWASEKFEVNKVMEKQVQVYRAMAAGEPPLRALAD